MLNTVLWYFLRSWVLESQSGRNTGTKIRGDMISKLISGYLFNYGISLDWDGVSHDRPSYMRKGAFKPCECKMCFFCVKGLTNGITHRPSKTGKVVVQYKCGTRVKTNQCMGERVDLGLGCSYCRMCYRKLLGTTATEQEATVRRRMCRASRIGCPICNEPICKECW